MKKYANIRNQAFKDLWEINWNKSVVEKLICFGAFNF